jgi:hypothetical protein
LGQTEPFLRALARSLAPLEDGLARTADAVRASHAETTRLSAETQDGLHAVTDALTQAQSAFSSSAAAVGERADAAAALIGRMGVEAGHIAELLAEVEERSAAARMADRELIERRVAAAVTELQEPIEANGGRSAELLQQTEERLVERNAATTRSIERALRESGADLGAALREATEATAARVAGAAEGLTAQLEALRGAAERFPAREDVAAVLVAAERTIALLGATERSLAEQQAAAGASLERVLKEADAELVSLIDQTASELDTKLRAAMRANAEETASCVSASAEKLTTRLDALVVSSQEFASADDVAAVGASIAAAGERLPVLLDTLRTQFAEDQDQLAERVADSIAALDQGVKRVERLGDLIEAMATKRGFQELVSSEAALREEQAAYVASLGGASRTVEEQVALVTGHADDLAQRLEAAARDAAAIQRTPSETAELVAGTMAEANDRLEKALHSAFAGEVSTTTTVLRRELESGVPVAEVLRSLERLAATQADVVAAHDEVKAAAAAVADRTDELRARMDGWGEARSAPQLAEELAALEERIRRIEQYVADDLAAALSEHVSKHVVEALDERERERPKGLFKRA